MKRVIYFLFIIPIFVSNMLFSESLDIVSNKWSLGGDASLGIKSNFNGRTSFDVNIKPSVSLLAFDAWEFGLQPIINFSIIRNFPVVRVGWGGYFYTRRYFEIRDNIYYYAGIRLGSQIIALDKQTFKAVGGIENGLLIGLGKVALDIGIPASVHFNLNNGFEYIEIPIGYFGIKAFF